MKTRRRRRSAPGVGFRRRYALNFDRDRPLRSAILPQAYLKIIVIPQSKCCSILHMPPIRPLLGLPEADFSQNLGRLATL